ncbi:hypothetical protein SK128_027264 [Halocaridina rubra]|uniref:Uncharacterized protein n=1 Tax=Halocaridina rubra TaxID=373956 RepID=A0AAN9A2P7_HALRR
MSHSSYHVVEHLRAEVKTFGKVGCAILVSDKIEISYEGAFSQVPVDLYNHLAWLLAEGDECFGEDGKVQLTKDDEEKSESAREKYIKALPFMTSVSESVKQMAHMASPQSGHHKKLRKDDMEAVL